MTDRVGFVGLGNMGFPVAERLLLAAGYPVLAFDVRADAVAALVALGPTPPPRPLRSPTPRETVLASPPTPQAARAVATDISAGARVRRLVDLSTIGATTAQAIHTELASSGIGYVDSPVSGGAAGARAGTLCGDDLRSRRRRRRRAAVARILLAGRSGSGRSRVRRRP